MGPTGAIQASTNGWWPMAPPDFSGKVLLRVHTNLRQPGWFGLTSPELMRTTASRSVAGPTPFPNGADYSLWLLLTYVRV